MTTHQPELPADLRWKIETLNPSSCGVVSLNQEEWSYVVAALSRPQDVRHWSLDAAEALRTTVDCLSVSDGPTGRDHLLSMLDRMQAEQFSATKACRWLGWIQCALVMRRIASLDDMKAHNAKFSATPTAGQGGDAIYSPVSPEEEEAIDKSAGLAKVVLRLPIDLLGEIDHRAQQDGCVRNAYLRELLAKHHTTPAPAAPVSERAREILKNEMGGFGTDEQGRIPLEYALRALEQALTQPSDAQRERDLLAEAIANAGIKCGLLRKDIEGMTGPQLLMICDDMADALTQQRGEPVASICLVTDRRLPHFAAAEIQLYDGYEPKIGDALFTTPQPSAEGLRELTEATQALLHAVCGETGFAAAVRAHSGTAYPWPALDIAEEHVRSVLKSLLAGGGGK